MTAFLRNTVEREIVFIISDAGRSEIYDASRRRRNNIIFAYRRCFIIIYVFARKSAASARVELFIFFRFFFFAKTVRRRRRVPGRPGTTAERSGPRRPDNNIRANYYYDWPAVRFSVGGKEKKSGFSSQKKKNPEKCTRSANTRVP